MSENNRTLMKFKSFYFVSLSIGCCCLQMYEVLVSIAESIKNFAAIYLVDITEVPDFNTMYV
ncbi:unnamed protein product [Rhodiola kirilowii]